LVQPDAGDFGYSYEVEGYTLAGLPRPGQSGSAPGSQHVLVVALPQ